MPSPTCIGSERYAHTILTHATRRMQSKICNATEYIHARHAAKKQRGMKGLEGRKKREKKARAQEHGAGHTPPDMEIKTTQGRRQRKNRTSVNKQEGRRKPRRGGNRAGEGSNTLHTAHPAPANTKEPPPPHTLQGTSPQQITPGPTREEGDARRGSQHRGKKNGWQGCMPLRRNTHIQEEQVVCPVPTSK